MTLLTFRLDTELRQRLRARLAREGRTMSEVVTHGLRQYVQDVADPPSGFAGTLVLPERVAAWLRELRSTGRSELLSATLAALNDAGWPLRPLADALGISRQAVQARVRRLVSAELREQVTNCEPPPPFPHRRVTSAAGLRPHLTIKIDQALRASAHRAAADKGHSLSQVVESILDRYLRHGLPDQVSRSSRSSGSSRRGGLGGQSSRRSTKIMRHASGASKGRSASKSP